MDLSEMMQKLLSDPAAVSAVTELAGKLANGSAVQSAEAPKTEEKPANADMGSLLSSVLANPDIMAKMPQMLSSLSALQSPAPKAPTDSRSALLCALKPYLSDGRAQNVDNIIKIVQIIDLFSSLK